MKVLSVMFILRNGIFEKTENFRLSPISMSESMKSLIFWTRSAHFLHTKRYSTALRFLKPPKHQ